MHEPVPREVVQMPFPAREEKTSRDGICVAPLVTIHVDEPREFWTERIRFAFEQAGVELCQQPALDAPEPSRERLDGYASFGLLGKGVESFTRTDGRDQ